MLCIDDKVNRVLGELERVQEKMYDFEGRNENFEYLFLSKRKKDESMNL